MTDSSEKATYLDATDPVDTFRNVALLAGATVISTTATHAPIGLANIFGLEGKLFPGTTENISLFDLKLEASLDQLANATQLAGLATIFLSELKIAKENNKDVNFAYTLLASMATILTPHYFTKLIDNLSKIQDALARESLGEAIIPGIEIATVGVFVLAQLKAANVLWGKQEAVPDKHKPRDNRQSPQDVQVIKPSTPPELQPEGPTNTLGLNEHAIDLLLKHVNYGDERQRVLAEEIQGYIREHQGKGLRPAQGYLVQQEISIRYEKLGVLLRFEKLASPISTVLSKPARRRQTGTSSIISLTPQQAEDIRTGKTKFK